jgi:chromate transporter
MKNPCRSLFIVFSKVSFFTLGGGLAMLPLLQAEIVEKKKWMSEEEFIDIVGISQSLPGVIIVNFATFAGYKILRARGAMIAAIGTVVPPFIAIIIAVKLVFSYMGNPIFEKFFQGCRPAVVALMVIPVFSLWKSAQIRGKTIFIPVIAIVFLVFLKIHPAYIVLAGIILNAFCVVWRNKIRREL